MWSEARKKEKNDVPIFPPIAWVPLRVYPSLTSPSSVDELPTSLWRGEGRMWLGSLVLYLLGMLAHIPQERGGAPGGVVACSWEGVELARAKVVVR
jgi:hypothetical protein